MTSVKIQAEHQSICYSTDSELAIYWPTAFGYAQQPSPIKLGCYEVKQVRKGGTLSE